MKNKFIIKTLATESLGVRSFANYIETPDLKILIDPGCALGPIPKLRIPHPIEYKKLIEKTNEIIEYAKNSDIIIISHYHNDHFKNFVIDYNYIYTNKEIAESIYSNKTIFLKDYKNSINYSQKKRANIFISNIKKICDKFLICDGKTFNFGETILNFSKPIFHGENNSKRGWIVMTHILILNDNKKSIIFTSDVQGPSNQEAFEFILKYNPDIIFLDGPSLRGLNNIVINYLKKLALSIDKIVIDHHLLRYLNWKEWLKEFVNDYRSRFCCAAEFNKEKILQLEANRLKLYKNQPVSEDFLKWSKINEKDRKFIEPPL